MCITLKSEVKRNAEMYYLMREPDMKKIYTESGPFAWNVIFENKRFDISNICGSGICTKRTFIYWTKNTAMNFVLALKSIAQSQKAATFCLAWNG